MTEIPYTCICGTVTMVNLDALELRPAGKIEILEGYTCGCGKWNTVFVTTVSMEEVLKKLERLNPARSDFLWHFNKALKKAIGIRQKAINDGAI